MRKLIFVIATILLINSNLLFPAKIKLKNRFPLHCGDKQELYLSGGISVDPYGNFIIPDAKVSNIKIFSKSGRLLKVIGRKGVGPAEFLIPFRNVSDSKRLAFLDFGRRRCFVYEFAGPAQLKDIKQGKSIPVNAGVDCCLYNDLLFLAAFVLDPDGNSCELYSVNLTNGKTSYVLPSHEKYGLSSTAEYRKVYRNTNSIVAIGTPGYCDAYNGKVYYVWEGDLRILRIDIKTGDIEEFWIKTDKYVQPFVSDRLAIAYEQKERMVMAVEKSKFSIIDDINVSKNYIVLSYMTPSKTAGRRSRMLQFYGHDMKFISEIEAPKEVSFSDEDESAVICMNRETDSLIFLRRFLDAKDEDKFEILVYNIYR